jgi:dTDP-4-amino-4,6-dideoxygalactose transaminase
VVAPGFKYNMPDLNAAVGLSQLEQAEEFRTGRERCARYYTERLSAVPDLDLPVLQVKPQDHAWHIFPVVLQPGTPVSRNRCIELLAERGIGTSVHYKPLHRMTYYIQTYAVQPGDYPQAERTWQGCLSLPLYPTMTDGELDYVCTALEEILRPARASVAGASFNAGSCHAATA